jgi:hypothetical protein
MEQRVSDDAIIDALKRNDMAQLRRWGRQGVQMTSAVPLVCHAISGASLDMVRCLINDLGVDVNAEDKGGYTVFWIASGIASEVGRLNLVRELLKLKTDINHATNDGRVNGQA